MRFPTLPRAVSLPDRVKWCREGRSNDEEIRSIARASRLAGFAVIGVHRENVGVATPAADNDGRAQRVEPAVNARELAPPQGAQ
jgi:hypothetical protein